MDVVAECKDSTVDLVDLSIFTLKSSQIWGIEILVAFVGLSYNACYPKKTC